MALQGNYNFKGIDIPSAYLMIKDITYNKSIQLEPFEITAPVLDDKNIIIEEAVIENREVVYHNCRSIVAVYKDKSTKELDPESYFTTKEFNFKVEVDDDSKNNTIQSYNYIKGLEEFSDLADV